MQKPDEDKDRDDAEEICRALLRMTIGTQGASNLFRYDYVALLSRHDYVLIKLSLAIFNGGRSESRGLVHENDVEKRSGGDNLREMRDLLKSEM